MSNDKGQVGVAHNLVHFVDRSATACLLAILLVSSACCLMAVASPDPPSTAYLAAALRNQEGLAGPALDVTYTVDAIGEPKVNYGRLELRYVRTNAILFLQESARRYTATGEWLLIHRAKYSYNRGTKEFRALTTPVATPGASVGEVRSGFLLSRFNQNTVLDPPRFAMLTLPLNELIIEGTVAPLQQSIDQYTCWQVDLPRQEGVCSDVSWSVWLDPEIGNCPRGITRSGPGSRGTTTTTLFRHYAQESSGTWFPREVSVQYGDGNGLRMLVQGVRTGQPVPETDITVTFPTGTRVVDHVLDATYTVP